jgi:hypothetical protein
MSWIGGIALLFFGGFFFFIGLLLWGLGVGGVGLTMLVVGGTMLLIGSVLFVRGRRLMRAAAARRPSPQFTSRTAGDGPAAPVAFNCPDCGAPIAPGTRECSFCGQTFG